jgi:hypothetical protein
MIISNGKKWTENGLIFNPKRFILTELGNVWPDRPATSKARTRVTKYGYVEPLRVYSAWTWNKIILNV